MGAFNRFSVFPARIGDILLNQLGSADLRTANTKSEPVPGGAISRRAVITAFADPMSTIRTSDMDKILRGGSGSISGSEPKIDLRRGYAWSTGDSQASTLIQYQRRVDGGEFHDPDLFLHEVLSANKGYAHITEITADQDDPMGVQATIDLYHLSLDGVVDPVAWSSVSQLAQQPTFNDLFYLADVYVGDFNVTLAPTRLEGVQSVRISTGIQYVPKRAGGSPFATVGSIVRAMPEIRIRTTDLRSVVQLFPKASNVGSLFGYGFRGTPNTDAMAPYVKCFFARGVHGGTRVDYATTTHFAISCTAGDQTPDSISATEIDDGLIELVIRPIVNQALDITQPGGVTNLIYEPDVAIPTT